MFDGDKIKDKTIKKKPLYTRYKNYFVKLQRGRQISVWGYDKKKKYKVITL